MPNNIEGVGVVGLRDPANASMLITTARVVTFSETRSVDVVKGYSPTNCTPLRDFDAAEKESEFVCTVGTGIIDEDALNWIVFNNPRQTSASIPLPNLVSGVISGGTLTVSGLVADQPNVSVVIYNTTAPGNLSLAPQPNGGTIDPTVFEVTLDTITVDPIYNGKTAIVYYQTTATSVEITGGNVPYQPYQNIEIFMKVCGKRFADKRIWFPLAESITGAEFDPEADNFSREYRCFLPPGYEVPYVMFDAV